MDGQSVIENETDARRHDIRSSDTGRFVCAKGKMRKRQTNVTAVQGGITTPFSEAITLATDVVTPETEASTPTMPFAKDIATIPPSVSSHARTPVSVSASATTVSIANSAVSTIATTEKAVGDSHYITQSGRRNTPPEESEASTPTTPAAEKIATRLLPSVSSRTRTSISASAVTATIVNPAVSTTTIPEASSEVKNHYAARRGRRNEPPEASDSTNSPSDSDYRSLETCSNNVILPFDMLKESLEDNLVCKTCVESACKKTSEQEAMGFIKYLQCHPDETKSFEELDPEEIHAKYEEYKKRSGPIRQKLKRQIRLAQ